MNIYRVSTIFESTRQTQSWWFLAESEEEVREMMKILLGDEACKYIKLQVERIPFRKGMLCAESNNREVWMQAFKPEEYKKLVEEEDGRQPESGQNV